MIRFTLKRSTRLFGPPTCLTGPATINRMLKGRIGYRYNSTSASASASSTTTGGMSFQRHGLKPREDGEVETIIVKNSRKDEKGNDLRLFITERASKRLQEIEQEDREETYLRITVESGGCHGFQYNLALKTSKDIDKEDTILDRNGAKVAIDESSLSMLRDSKVDYTTELIGSQFKIVDSPYTKSSCGCGTSFDFDFSKLE